MTIKKPVGIKYFVTHRVVKDLTPVAQEKLLAELRAACRKAGYNSDDLMCSWHYHGTKNLRIVTATCTLRKAQKMKELPKPKGSLQCKSAAIKVRFKLGLERG